MNDTSSTSTDRTDDQAAPLPQPDPDASNTAKDPEAWVTGDEPMTGAQQSYLGTLAQEVGREVPADLTKAQASELIDELRAESERVDADS